MSDASHGAAAAPAVTCPVCSYSQRGLAGVHRCPECGLMFDEHTRVWTQDSLMLGSGCWLGFTFLMVIAWLGWSTAVYPRLPASGGFRFVVGAVSWNQATARMVVLTAGVAMALCFCVSRVRSARRGAFILTAPDELVIQTFGGPVRSYKYNEIADVDILPRGVDGWGALMRLQSGNVVDLTPAASPRRIPEIVHAIDERRRAPTPRAG